MTTSDSATSELVLRLRPTGRARCALHSSLACPNQPVKVERNVTERRWSLVECWLALVRNCWRDHSGRLDSTQLNSTESLNMLRTLQLIKVQSEFQSSLVELS